MKRKSEQGKKGKLSYMELTYLMQKPYMMDMDHIEMYGIKPNNCRLDENRKIALGICYQSDSGQDYCLNKRLIDYLKEVDKKGWDCYCGISIKGKWQLINAVNLLTLLKRTNNADWRPGKFEFSGEWVYIDNDLSAVEQQSRIGVASPLINSNSLSSRAIAARKR